MKTIPKTLMTIILGAFLLVGCGGYRGGQNRDHLDLGVGVGDDYDDYKGTRQNEDHLNLARLFAKELNRVFHKQGVRYDTVLLRAWTNQTGYAIYYDRNNFESGYVAVNLNRFTGPNHPDIGSYYRENVVTNLVQSKRIFKIPFHIVKGDTIIRYYIINQIYTDPNTGKQYSDTKGTYGYYTGMELGFIEENKIEKFSEILRTQFNVSEDKAPVIAELAMEFASLDPDSMDRKTANWYAQEMTGVSFDEMEQATADPVEIHKLFVKAATHIGIPTQNAYNLMGLFLLQ